MIQKKNNFPIFHGKTLTFEKRSKFIFKDYEVVSDMRNLKKIKDGVSLDYNKIINFLIFQGKPFKLESRRYLFSEKCNNP